MLSTSAKDTAMLDLGCATMFARGRMGLMEALEEEEENTSDDDYY